MFQFRARAILVLALAALLVVPAAASAKAKNAKLVIVKKPAALTGLTTASFTFTVKPKTGPAQCHLDGGKFATCKSGVVFKALATGKHTFFVRVPKATKSKKFVTEKFSWTVDATPPTAGTITDISGAISSIAPFTVTYATGTDAGAGIKTAVAEGRTGTLANNVCTFGAWSPLAASPVTITLANAQCGEYRVTVTDNVGNVHVYSSGIRKVDTTPPTITLAPFNSYIVGNGDVDLSGTATDSLTKVEMVSVLLSPGTVQHSVPVAADGTWHLHLTGLAEAGYYATIDAYDSASNIDCGCASTAFYIDSSTIVLTQTGGTTAVTEHGPGNTDSVAVTLSMQPTDEVTINIGSGSLDNDVSDHLVFDPTNWNVPQVVTFTASDDHLANSTNPYITTVSFDEAGTTTDDHYYYEYVDLPVSITDQTTAALAVTRTGADNAVTEGDATPAVAGTTDTFSVHLLAMPTGTVTVTPAPSSGVTATPASMTFTPANWNTPQVVAVAAVPNDVAEDDLTRTESVTLQVSALNPGDAAIDGAASEQLVTVTDDDAARVGISATIPPTALTETAGASNSATLTLKLNTQPTSDVTVLVGDVSGRLEVNGHDSDYFNFTDADWHTPQTLTISAVDDSEINASTLAQLEVVTIMTSDHWYGPTLAPVTIDMHVTDNDSASLVVSPGALAADEGDEDTFTIKLATKPSDPVVIKFPAPAGGEFTTSPSSITFNSSTWDTPRTVHVSAVQGQIPAVPVNVTATITSSDTHYAALTFPTKAFTITRATSAVVFDTSTVSVAEATPGTLESVNVHLANRPTAPVTLTFTPASGRVDTSVDTLVFTRANWNEDQGISINAVNDALANATDTVNIAVTASGTDASYTALVVPPIVATVTDNEDASIIGTATGGSTDIVIGGAGDTFNVTLASQPEGNVDVTLASMQPFAFGGAAVADTLHFTTSTWDDPQTVTISVTDAGATSDWVSATATGAVPYDNSGTAQLVFVNVTP